MAEVRIGIRNSAHHCRGTIEEDAIEVQRIAGHSKLDSLQSDSPLHFNNI
jgi:hypothetical protein